MAYLWIFQIVVNFQIFFNKLIEKDMCVSGPTQFILVLFKDQLYFKKYTHSLVYTKFLKVKFLKDSTLNLPLSFS